MSTVPATNAVLLSVFAVGGAPVDGYDDTAGLPEAVWTGRVAGYLRRPRKTMSRPDGGTVRVHDDRDDELVLQASLAGGPLLFLTGGGDEESSRVLVEDQRSGQARSSMYLVKGLDTRVAGTPADSVRLTLRRET